MKHLLILLLAFTLLFDSYVVEIAEAGTLVRNVRASSGAGFRSRPSTQAARSVGQITFSKAPATLESNPFEKRIIQVSKAELKYYAALNKWEQKTTSIKAKNAAKQREVQRKRSEKEARDHARLRQAALKQQQAEARKRQEVAEKAPVAPVAVASEKSSSLSENQRQPRPSSVFTDNSGQNREGDRILLSRRAKPAPSENTEAAETHGAKANSLWLHFKRALTGF